MLCPNWSIRNNLWGSDSRISYKSLQSFMLKWNRSVLYDRVKYLHGAKRVYYQRFPLSVMCGKSVMPIAGSVRQGIDFIAF